jgi:hypothetical protein
MTALQAGVYKHDAGIPRKGILPDFMYGAQLPENN